MKRLLNLGFLTLTLMLSSCSADIELEDYLDMSAPLVLVISSTDPETGVIERKPTTLEVNSEKWKTLVNWGKNKKEGWTPSPASHIGDIHVMQGDFTLTHTRGSKGVVIAFIDKEGNPKQYMNGIEKGELSFLYE